MKVILKILLAAAVVVLTYMCYKSITGPIEFNKAKAERDEAIITRLINIRKAQIEYKNVHNVHAATFEDLAKFLDNEKLSFLYKEGVLTDEQLESGLTEKEAVEKGLIVRDTVWVLAKDTLFGKGFNSADLANVPNTDGATFKMDTATLKSGAGYEIKVFEAAVDFDTYLKDLDAQLLYNLKDKAEKMGKYAGLRVGSLTEINNNAGNWEN